MLTAILTALTLLTAPAETYRITGYVANEDCGRFCDGLTASGVPADPSRKIVACPPQLDLGVRVRIQGLGVFTCLDRGGLVKGKRLDVLVKSRAAAYRITGKRKVRVLSSKGVEAE